MTEKTGMEKRRYDRIILKGYIADIGDGKFAYGGIIEDVSADGLRLNDLPAKFAVEGKRYTIVISGGSSDDYFKLTVFPRWRSKRGRTVDVGFRVVKSSPGWKTLIRKVIPKVKEEEDVWDQYIS